MVGCCSGPGGGGGGASSSGRKRTYRGWGSRSPQKGFIKEGKALAWRRPRDFCLPRGCAQRLQAWKSLFCTNTSVPAIQRSCRRLLMPAAAAPGPPPPLRRRLGAAWPIRQRPSFPVCSQQPLRSLSCPQRPWTPRPLRPWGRCSRGQLPLPRFVAATPTVLSQAAGIDRQAARRGAAAIAPPPHRRFPA